ncbi:MAG: hypothetical protein R3C40_12215 [Parvularculaceae bacterium]
MSTPFPGALVSPGVQVFRGVRKRRTPGFGLAFELAAPFVLLGVVYSLSWRRSAPRCAIDGGVCRCAGGDLSGLFLSLVRR